MITSTDDNVGIAFVAILALGATPLTVPNTNLSMSVFLLQTSEPVAVSNACVSCPITYLGEGMTSTLFVLPAIALPAASKALAPTSLLLHEVELKSATLIHLPF
jgi:hypothetical protein